MKNEIKTCKKCQKTYNFLSTECDLCADCVEKFPYFLSIVEEGFAGVIDKTFGRVEVYFDKEPTEYAIDEFRFLFKENLIKVKEFKEFRDKWDFKNVSEKELEEIKRIIKSNFLNNMEK